MDDQRMHRQQTFWVTYTTTDRARQLTHNERSSMLQAHIRTGRCKQRGTNEGESKQMQENFKIRRFYFMLCELQDKERKSKNSDCNKNDSYRHHQ